MGGGQVVRREAGFDVGGVGPQPHGDPGVAAAGVGLEDGGADLGPDPGELDLVFGQTGVEIQGVEADLLEGDDGVVGFDVGFEVAAEALPVGAEGAVGDSGGLVGEEDDDGADDERLGAGAPDALDGPAEEDVEGR